MKLLVGFALVIVGGLLTIATAAAGFVGGVAVAIWMKDEQEKSDLEKTRQRRGDRSGAGLDKLFPSDAPLAEQDREVPS